jgi:Ca-activated chloride channel homolog
MRKINFAMKPVMVAIFASLILAGCGSTGDNGPISQNDNDGNEQTELDVRQQPLNQPTKTDKKENEEDAIRHDGRVFAPAETRSISRDEAKGMASGHGYRMKTLGAGSFAKGEAPPPNWNTESYDVINENEFRDPINNPLSTFSIDVDVASYANVRRFITQSQLPPKDAVRIEELINYFSYDYPQPKNKHPFSINTELSDCPWNTKHKLVHIGLQGKRIDKKNLPPSNIVFLLDVSGSMNSPKKLPLLKQSFRLLVNEMRPEDRVAIVVYAGAAGVVLPSTPGSDKTRILGAIEQLSAGGSTAGGQGIKLAYKIAKENLMREGNNRIILATDGDFNIGASSDAEMVRLIEEKREDGIFLTVLGFGMGNYKDSKMEKLADKGNGNYAYIDDILEAKKTLVSEFGATMFTIAKDVKIQVEFNPTKVAAYRLVGYENRLLNKEDFNDDKKDAGELGAGHTVTALYEIIPAGVESEYIKKIDDLKYQKPSVDPNAKHGDEVMMVKLRYKKPDATKSQLITMPIKDLHTELSNASDAFKFSAAVAVFGMLLRESEFTGNYAYKDAIALARASMGKDEAGYRHDFVKMAERCELLSAGS